MLLTSGQISMGISSCIVFLFTSLLFLSGYIVQQQTVHSLQIALHPAPSPTATSAPQLPAARPFGTPPPYQHLPSTSTINWARAAYAQVVHTHTQVCNAVMFFADLARQESRARRVLLYPAAWDREAASAESPSRSLSTSMRLLGEGTDRYGIEAIPVEEEEEEAEADGEEVAHSLARFLDLGTFERVLYLRAPGLVLDARAVDTLFATRSNASVAVFAFDAEGESSAAIVRPSFEVYQEVMGRRTNASASRDTSASAALERFTRKLPTTRLISDTEFLRSQSEEFDAMAFQDETAYLRFTDPEILGPEYDIPRGTVFTAMPVDEGARRVWEGAYELYRSRRMQTCGLDLEPMPSEGQ